ncbi:MAG: metallophosphoesterase [Ruminococcus sp.]|nr:metallophosphoesterase [Ruminococcus sp.]
MMTFFLIVLCILAVLIVWFFIERCILLTRKKEIFLRAWPKELNGMRILQISDLHHRTFGRDNIRISRRVQRIQPDIIVITGDLISRDMRDFTAVGRFCRNLAAIAPVYFVPGNHELDLPSKVRETYYKTLRGANGIILDNRSCSIKSGGGSVSLVGTTLDISIYHDGDHKYRNLNPYSKEELIKQIGVHDGCTILLAHNPLIAEAYADWGADLVLCGHVHGGVMHLPFIGGVLSPERRFFPRYSKGLYRIGDTCMYVSGGLGKIRLFNPSEINLITLRNQE